MSINREQVLASVLKTANQAVKGKYNFTAESDLYGGDSPIDSLILVNFIMDLESEVTKMFGAEIKLDDDRASEREPSPLSSVQELTDYIVLLLQEK